MPRFGAMSCGFAPTNVSFQTFSPCNCPGIQVSSLRRQKSVIESPKNTSLTAGSCALPRSAASIVAHRCGDGRPRRLRQHHIFQLAPSSTLRPYFWYVL